MGVQGSFLASKYQSSDGTFIYRARVQPETTEVAFGGIANAPPAGAITPFLPSATMSGGKRTIGVHPRTASCKVTAVGVGASNALNSIVRIPILSKTTAWVEGMEGVYQGDTLRIVKINPEIRN